MQPLDYDLRSLYRKHQTGEESEDGLITPIFETDGPYLIAFRPGSRSRTLTEQGYTDNSTTFYCIADGIDCIESGDILTDGTTDLFVVGEVKTFPTEQTFYARSLT